jgi:hypothetical protein
MRDDSVVLGAAKPSIAMTLGLSVQRDWGNCGDVFQELAVQLGTRYR